MIPQSWRAGIFWSILLLDTVYQFARYGGLAVVDFAVHGCFLLAATCVVFTRKTSYDPPRLLVWIWAPVFTLGLLQLMPLPPALFELLAPIKTAQSDAIRQIVPEVTTQTQLAILPSYHLMLLSKLALDAYLTLLVLVGPRPTREVFRFWIRLIAGFLSILMIITGRGLLRHVNWLESYRDTYGGLVNTNHFALVAVILVLLCLQSFTYGAQQTYREWRSAAGHKSRVLTTAMQPLIDLVLLNLCFLAFRYAHSRSGVALMVLGIAAFFGQTAIKAILRKKAGIAPKFALAGLVFSLIFLSTIPLGRHFTKFQRDGLAFGQRVEAMKVGLHFLEQWPILGTGLGATYQILPAQMSVGPAGGADWTEFHNDYIQIGVEMGVIGLASCGLMIWLLIYLLTANKETKDQNYFVLAARSIALVVALHCMVSFPLRVPAIRIFVILIMAVAARHAGNNKPRHVFSRHLLAALPLFLLALAYTISQASVPIEQQYPESHYASKYGRSFELPLLEANQLIDSIWTVDVDEETAHARLAEARALAIQYLDHCTFSLAACNTIFTIDVIEARMNAAPWRHLKEKAMKIQQLGHKDNAQNKTSTMFLLSSFEDELDESERSELGKLRETFAARIGQTQRNLGL